MRLSQPKSKLCNILVLFYLKHINNCKKMYRNREWKICFAMKISGSVVLFILKIYILLIKKSYANGAQYFTVQIVLDLFQII